MLKPYRTETKGGNGGNGHGGLVGRQWGWGSYELMQQHDKTLKIKWRPPETPTRCCRWQDSFIFFICL